MYVRDDRKCGWKGYEGWLMDDVKQVVIEGEGQRQDVAVLELKSGERLPLVVCGNGFNDDGDPCKGRYDVINRLPGESNDRVFGIVVSDEEWEFCREIGEQVARYMNGGSDREEREIYKVQLRFI